MKRCYAVSFLLLALTSLSACDKINNASRTMDTMLGGDYEVRIQGFDKPFQVKGGKVTSVLIKVITSFTQLLKVKSNWFSHQFR